MTPPEPVQDLVDRFLLEVDARLSGELTGLFLHGSICWREFFPGSDVDFVAVWDHLPSGERLDPARIDHRPAHYQGAFDERGRIDINLVTWHELALHPVVVRGEVPEVYTSLPELHDFTRNNLDGYWRGTAEQVGSAGVDAIGDQDEAIAWITLGAARLHHVLSQHRITSKSGAGRYVIEHLDPRWSPIAEEALRIRERPGTPSLYDDATRRGQDTYDLLCWLVEDGLSLPRP